MRIDESRPGSAPEREKKLVNVVLALHKDVRFCGIVNKEGEAIAMNMKPGVESLSRLQS